MSETEIDSTRQYVTLNMPRMFLRIISQSGDRVAVEDERRICHEVEAKDLIPVMGYEVPDLISDKPHAYISGGRIRIATFDGLCISCNRRCYTLNDGDNDGLGDNGDSGLDAQDFDLIGPHVPMCVVCANTAERYEAGVETAKAERWKPKPPRIKVLPPRTPPAQS